MGQAFRAGARLHVLRASRHGLGGSRVAGCAGESITLKGIQTETPGRVKQKGLQ